MPTRHCEPASRKWMRSCLRIPFDLATRSRRSPSRRLGEGVWPRKSMTRCCSADFGRAPARWRACLTVAVMKSSSIAASPKKTFLASRLIGGSRGSPARARRPHRYRSGTVLPLGRPLVGLPPRKTTRPFVAVLREHLLGNEGPGPPRSWRRRTESTFGRVPRPRPAGARAGRLHDTYGSGRSAPTSVRTRVLRGLVTGIVHMWRDRHRCE